MFCSRTYVLLLLYLIMIKRIWHMLYITLKLVKLSTQISLQRTTAVARTLIGGGGCLFIYSCSARLVSFEIKFKFINLKRN